MCFIFVLDILYGIGIVVVFVNAAQHLHYSYSAGLGSEHTTQVYTIYSKSVVVCEQMVHQSNRAMFFHLHPPLPPVGKGL